MKNKVIVIFIIEVVLLVFTLTSSIYAANEDIFTIKLETDTTQIKQGETVTVNLYIDNINVSSGEEGIGAFTAKLEYDTNIFENITSSGSDKWDNPSIQESGVMAGVKSDGMVTSTRQLVGTIKLKVKEDATIGSTTIKILDLQGANGDLIESAVTGTQSQLSFLIESKIIVDPNTNDPTTPKEDNPSITTTPKEDNPSNQNLPKTGENSYFILIIPILLMIESISYMMYRKYKKVK